MTQQAPTPLYDEHVRAGGRMTPFAGWAMPLHYGSQIAEHHAVRRDAGMFDVSHMNVMDIDGAGAEDFLRIVFANDVARMGEDAALYGVLLNEAGGIIDDAIVYRLEDGFRLVANAATRERVSTWLATHSDGRDASVRSRPDLAMVALQGPRALERFGTVTGIDAAPLAAFALRREREWLVARTGYTGEDGVEIILPAADAPALWRHLAEAGVAPAGLAARDTLRLEAGLNLYGQDMDESTTPMAANLGWTVAWDPPERPFIGREAVAQQRRPGSVLRGIVLDEKGVMRAGCPVLTDAGEGVVTSGIFSPTLGYSIAFARVPRGVAGPCRVRIRAREAAARIVRPPFVRQGQQVFRA